jgi:hypothetical protein
MPEVAVNLSYNLSERAAVFAGYNFLYLSNALRVGGTIDPTVNDSAARFVANPTPGNSPGPTFTFRDEAFWLQGVNLGVRLEF